jgi:hypothetical protein
MSKARKLSGGQKESTVMLETFHQKHRVMTLRKMSEARKLPKAEEEL